MAFLFSAAAADKTAAAPSSGIAPMVDDIKGALSRNPTLPSRHILAIVRRGKTKDKVRDLQQFVAALSSPADGQLSVRAAVRALFSQGREYHTLAAHYVNLGRIAGPLAADSNSGNRTYTDWSTNLGTNFGDMSSLAAIFDEYKVMGVQCTYVPVPQTTVALNADLISTNHIAVGYDPDSNVAPATVLSSSSLDRIPLRMLTVQATTEPVMWQWKNENLPNMMWADLTASGTVVSGGSANNGCVYYLTQAGAQTVVAPLGNFMIKIAVAVRVRF